MIRAGAINRSKQGFQDRVDLYIAVVVHSRFACCFQMEGVDHVHVLQIRRSRFVRHIQWVFERQVPDGESLKLCVSRLFASRVFVIELAQTNRHLAATRSGSSYHHQRTRGLDIIIAAEALLGSNQLHVMRITLDGIMIIHTDAFPLQPLAVRVCGTLARIVRNHYRRDQKSTRSELFAETQDIFIIRNTQILANFITLNIQSGNNDNDLQ